MSTGEKTPHVERLLELREELPFHIDHRTWREGRDHLRLNVHYPLEVGVVLEGTIRRHFEEGYADLEKGDLWMAGMWEPHGISRASHGARDVFVMIWPPLLFNLHLPEAAGVPWMAPFTVQKREPCRLAPEAREEALRLGERLAALRGETVETALAAIRFALLELLLLGVKDGAGATAPPASSPVDYGRLGPALELAMQAKDRLSVQEGAQHCGMGERYFAREFQRLMGLSFPKFCLRQRLFGAAQELAKTRKPIKSLAWEWGFTDASHFHRVFVEHYNCTPREYRMRIRRPAAGE